MKLKGLNLIFIFILIFPTLCFKVKNKFDVVKIQHVLQEITSELFDKENIFTIDVILCGEIKYKINLLIDEFMKELKGKYTVRTRKYFENKFEIFNPGIIFVETLEVLAIFLKNSSYSKLVHHTTGFLVYIRKDEKNFNKKFLRLIKPVMPEGKNGHLSQYIYFLFDDGKKMNLKTFEWWTQKSCGQPILQEINSYDYGTQKWHSEPFEIEKKFTNFHGCHFRYRSSYFHIYSLEILQRMNMVGFASFVQPKIREILEKRLEKDHEMRSIFARVGNFTFELSEKSPQLLQYPSLRDTRMCSMDFHKNPAVSMYSAPEPYTNYEKVILPFDALTWTLLIFVFMVTFCITSMFHILSQDKKKLFLSKSGKNNSINAIAIFFGDSQKKIPENNFPRIILMTFILFFFIMRNAYQSELEYNISSI